MHKNAIIFSMLIAILFIAVNFLPIDPPFGFRINQSNSLPYRLFWSAKGKPDHLERGTIVAFTHPLSKAVLAKEIGGLPGDTITISHNQVYINHEVIGEIKLESPSGIKLSPIQEGSIDNQYFFARGRHEHSFDSRYAEFGLVNIENIKETLWPIF